ncbi:M23 family metallopeptidase [Parasulfitobacter algicola]|uniref:M23 family metallopeptidase n=1 Tax=Parasulfitobacter algicola TaxID=2614809 RepID=UPI0031B5FA7E
MKPPLRNRLNHALERIFPERRLFLRSDSDTRFILLKPTSQLLIWVGGSALIAWSIISTAILLMDNIGAGNFREQAKRDMHVYQARLNALASERDLRAAEALAAQERFNAALDQVSQMQTQLLVLEDRRKELETGMEAVHATLRRAMQERDEARYEVSTLTTELQDAEVGANGNAGSREMDGAVGFLSSALEQTAKERDTVIADAAHALNTADDLKHRIQQMEDQNDAIFRQLEEAMTVSVEPLEKMFSAAGMDTDSLLRQVRRGYSGQGGPLTPLSFSTRGEEHSANTIRANQILNKMDQLNLYRIAAEKAPFAQPVKSAFRFTSPFGFRRDPKTGGRRMHNGVDFAAGTGTPLYATADGVVTHAGWQSGYGRLVKIKHEFGIETRYAHLSALNVKVGQRVSRGDKIGGMGASGRVTGVHLHYEVRVGGKPVNPMTYIKAARDVF